MDNNNKNEDVDLNVIRRRIATYDRLASRHKWTKVKISTDNRVLRQRYKRRVQGNVNGNKTTDGGNETATATATTTDDDEFVVLDCWPTTGTIGSFLKHPRLGKTQLFRKYCTDDELDEIFHNPRAHTDKGYQQRQHQPHQQRNQPQQHEEDIDDRKRGRSVIVSDDSNDIDIDNDEYDNDKLPKQQNKRRRLACVDGQHCRDYSCKFSHPPRCFFGRFCWFQPNCWFDHTHGLCMYGQDCYREDCWFSHRHPDFYY
jgi:hypothetical protein